MTAGTRRPAASPRRSRNRRGEGALLREDILDAAARLLGQLGDEEKVTIRAVAAEVGVSPPSVYLHFADKDELIFAVCQQLFGELAARLEAAVAGIDDPAEALGARAKAYVRFGLDHPEHYRVLFMHKPHATPEGFGSEELLTSAAFANLLANVEALVASGRLLEGLEAFRVAIECWAIVHGITSLMISHPDLAWPDPDVVVGDACGHLLAGLLR